MRPPVTRQARAVLVGMTADTRHGFHVSGVITGGEGNWTEVVSLLVSGPGHDGWDMRSTAASMELGSHDVGTSAEVMGDGALLVRSSAHGMRKEPEVTSGPAP
jgi:hypothetical protein